MWKFLYKFSSPKSFYELSGKMLPWFAVSSVLCIAYGLVGGLVLAPPDYQQGDVFRIIYIHVPSAILSLNIYCVMAFCAVLSSVWKIKLSDVVIKVSAPLGAWFTFIALVTGSIWGKPTWGTWWIWDARLTSELILLFLYMGIISLQSAISDRNQAARSVNILVLVGVVNIPIIHYSVYWWNTLHQGATLSLLSKPKIADSMLYPLLAMIVGLFCYFVSMMLMRARTEVLEREKKQSWVRDVIELTQSKTKSARLRDRHPAE